MLTSVIDCPLFVLVAAETLHMQHAMLYLACILAALVMSSVLFVLLFQQRGVLSHILFCTLASSPLIEEL